jgi:CO/xanthine dehydrogenase Mo-binding subunit
MPKLIGKRIKRNEDPRLLTGEALFVDDVDIRDAAPLSRGDYARLRKVDRHLLPVVFWCGGCILRRYGDD